MIYYIFLMVLANSLSDIRSKLGSCFYVFQTMFLTVNFLHLTENLIQCSFQQAGSFSLDHGAFVSFRNAVMFLITSGTTFMQRLFKNLSRPSLTIFSHAF